jgi:hypothetical protein
VIAAVEETKDYLIERPARIEDHRCLPRWLHRGGKFHERHLRHRPGAVGHQGKY